ncbi:MAG: transporter [Candidatus Omnitrophica bacterium]|nr:transporter [Candidatus Omnitrophota bacterium]
MNFNLLIIIMLVLALPTQCRAVNFYDGARAKEGVYFLTYTSIYSADKTTDARGKTGKSDYDYTKSEELFRFCYYTPEAVFTALVPVAKVKSGYYDAESSGWGDAIVGAGYFLPLKRADVLPMVFVKFPSGEYDSTKAVNVGTNQYDIRPTVFLYKAIGRFSVDAAAKYYFRLENPGTDVSPGDELHVQGLLGWQFTKTCKAGPSVNWMRSRDQKSGKTKTPGTARESLSAGFDLYVRIAPVSVTLTYLRDIHTENTTKGDFVQLKTCYKF